MYWDNESIYMAVIGGSIISGATMLNMLVHGKVTGYSGALKSLTNSRHRLSRHFGLILGTILIANLCFLFKSSFFQNPATLNSGMSIEGFAISGFLVGFGTSLGNGCTSGHGVCGLPRLSKRSIVAVCVFCLFAILTATLRDNFPFLYNSIFPETSFDLSFNTSIIKISIIVNAVINLIILIITFKNKGIKEMIDYLISFTVGIMFGLGLVISGMVRREKVVGFLTLNKNWDPTLMFVLLTSVGMNFIVYQLVIKKMKRPLFMDNFDLPNNPNLDKKLVIGAAIFGIGWGISGLCPGPAIADLLLYLPNTGIFMLFLIAGQFLHGLKFD